MSVQETAQGKIEKIETPSTAWRPPALFSWLLLLQFAVVQAASGNQAVINADGVLEIDGRKIFVLGFNAAPPPRGKAPNGKNALAELADAGATFVRAGPESLWTEARYILERQYEDAAARYGLHCWLNLREASRIHPGDAANERLLRRILTTFRDHPGLGAYKGADEPEWGREPVAPLERAYQIVKELDPHHPLVIIQAPRGTIASLQRYHHVGDIFGADIYPVGYPPGRHSQFFETNSAISMVGDYTRRMREVARPNKAVWMTLQIAWSGVLNPGKTLRFPTFPEERFMTYQAIINGARGINYFGGGLPGGWSKEDRKLGWNWRFWNRVLRPVIEEVGTKSPLYPALVAPESKLPIRARGEGIEFCVREVGSEVFLLACKREGPTVQAEFSGLAVGGITGEVLFESPRQVQCKDGKFTDWFGPFEVHIYRFRS